MDTWGISGPRFLLIYVVLLGVATLLALAARRRALAGPGEGAPALSRLDPYEAADLNGGEGLVATTAVSSLLRGGQLANAGRRRGPVRLVTRAAPPAGVHPVEWAAYELVAAQPSRSLVRALGGRRPDSARVEPMAARAHLSTRAVRLAATMAGPRRRLVVTARAPGLGERWLSLPLARYRTPSRLGRYG
jgi:uncharacterized protein (TIGR04222 family)